MGQRGNYIIKSKNKIDIYYTHWRANCIAFDLALGSSKFIEFVKQFDKKEELVNEPWMEGCVFIDIDAKELLFWETESLSISSVRRKYLKYIQSKWEGWKVEFVEKEMYDIEKKLNIDYIINQKVDFDEVSIEKLKKDRIDDYVECIVVLKKNDVVQKKEIYSINNEELVLLGEQIITILENKPTTHLSKEIETDIWGIVVIDCDNKILLINESITGLADKLIPLWKDWKILAANFGYIEIIEKIGIDTGEIRMTEQEIDNNIQEILNTKDNFDPKKIANKFLSEGKNVAFHPNYFENIKPKNE